MKFCLAALPLALLALCPPALQAAETIQLSTLEVERIQQSYGLPHADQAVEGHGLSIAGQTYAHGIGTHANSEFIVSLKKGATRFSASVGVDDEVTNHDEASLEFEVVADGRSIWKSGVMKYNDPPKKVDLDVTGVDHLNLIVNDGGDGINSDHADWADAQLMLAATGERPHITDLPKEPAAILTPRPAAVPRLTGAKIFGVRPGAPFLFTITATGDRPMTFSAAGLPASLRLDPATGRITGTLPQAGEFDVTVGAKNDRGTAGRRLRLVAGDKIALTPPMGWNSWNCWAGAVDQQKVLQSAHALVTSGLAQHGWTYINIDDTWQGERNPQAPTRALTANAKFPDMKALCDEIHSLGLKAGIYSTPWFTSYAYFPGGSADTPDGAWHKHTGEQRSDWRFGQVSFAKEDAKQWADWGFDYLKYDWNPIDLAHVRAMTAALRDSGRDMVYSLSNSANPDLGSGYAEASNSWRTTGDITDTWDSMSGIGFHQDKWLPYAAPGHWNDPDMLVVGYVGWGAHLHPTHLSPNEQYTHISLWCLLSAPLLIGCDLDRLDEFTTSLLTNDEVLDIDQDSLGKAARQVAHTGGALVYVKELEDGSRAVGLFNTNKFAGEVHAKWSDLGLSGRQTVRDLWRQQDVGTFDGEYVATVPPHGVVLVRMTAAK